MRNRIIHWLTAWLGLLLAAGLLAAGTAAGAPIPRLLAQPSEDLAGAVWLLEDPAGTLSIDQVRSPALQARFTPWDPARGDVNLGFSASTWWLRVRLQRSPEAPAAWILNVPYAYNKFIDFHAPGLPVVVTGHARPPENRPLLGPHFAFPVRLESDAQDFYFRVASHYAVSFPLVAWQIREYSRHTLFERLLQALYHGALAAMVVYAFFIWLSSRDTRFGLYAAYGSALSLGILAGNGWGGILLWPQWQAFDEVSSGVFLSLTMAALLLLARSVLNSRSAAPVWLDRLAQGGAVLGAIHAGIMLASTGHSALATWLFQGLIALGLAAIVLIGALAWGVRHTATPGRSYFLLSWGVLSVGIAAGALRMLGWLPTNTLTAYAVQISTAIEMLLLSFMLASIVREERQLGLSAQARVIDVLQAQESRLERAVEERTRALADSVQSERRTLSEYLRFAALVSHEFRNGMNVISAQADLLGKQASDATVQTRTQVIGQQVARLAKLTDTWLKSDQILNSSSPPSIEAIDCRAWLAQAIATQPDGYDGHQISWEVAHDAATLWADRDLLEIVLTNLLSNACRYSPAQSPIVIRIHSQRNESGATLTGLSVQDRGEGIEPLLHERIFDRYFRVRPEGGVSGIGLGLNFVRHIAEQHHGHVELKSEPGRGSTFTVWFPDRIPPGRA